jgi:hypothetical protein
MVQLPILIDGRHIGHATDPPVVCGGEECAGLPRPCPRTACRFHLWPQDERAGRPHRPGSRPPVKLRTEGPSCMFDVLREAPDGLTTDEIGETFGVVGERISQMEHRAALKMEGIRRVFAGVETMQSALPPGIAIEGAFAHNDHALPNQHFVTVVLKVTPKDDKRRADASSRAGVRVRRKRT